MVPDGVLTADMLNTRKPQEALARQFQVAWRIALRPSKRKA